MCEKNSLSSGSIPPARNQLERNSWIIKVYQRWAAEEFLKAIEGHPDLYFAAEQFTRMVDDFACRNNKTAEMFVIAYDVAVELEAYLETLIRG